MTSTSHPSYSARELQLAGVYVRAKIMLDSNDQGILRACIEAYVAVNAIDQEGVDSATLVILRQLQPVGYLEGLQG